MGKFLNYIFSFLNYIYYFKSICIKISKDRDKNSYRIYGFIDKVGSLQGIVHDIHFDAKL